MLEEAERVGGSESGRVDGAVGVRCLSVCLSLTGLANTGVLPPRGGHGLWPVATTPRVGADSGATESV